jgi:hypothetical protein
LTIYVVDKDDYSTNPTAIGAVWKRLTGDGHPAVAGIGVAGSATRRF